MRVEELLHPNEEVLMFLRRDKWVLMKMAVFYGFLLLLPVIIYIIMDLVLFSVLQDLFAGEISRPIIVMAASIYYLYVWIFLFRAWLDYYLDVWFVTTERIVTIDQRGLFSRTIAEQKLFRIQDVHAEVHGIIPTLLDFGDVTVQTAATEVVFRFKEVPSPHQIARNIVQLAEWDKKNHNMQE